MKKSTGKRLRFEVFKRDGFTCQYCGQRPPDVVLELDHIHPVSQGGDNSDLNLTTACAACNRGKSDRALGLIHPRPDADLLYLEKQQEIVEAKRFLLAKQEMDELNQGVIDALFYHWRTLLTYGSPPEYHIFEAWLLHYPPDEIVEALKIAARKAHRGDITGRSEKVQYIWGILRQRERQQEEAAS